MYSRKSKLITWILIFTVILSNVNFMNLAYAQTTELIITGIGVNNEVNITASDWSKYKVVERTYSTNNSLNFHKIVKAKGYDLFELIGTNNLKTDKDYEVKFTCSDGFEFKKTVNELKSTYFYKDFTNNNKTNVMPMLATHTMMLADFPKDSFKPPVKWTDKTITKNNIDIDLPKLVFGQTSIDDMNMSKWGKQIIKITVGDVRPKDGAEGTGQSIDYKSSYKHISYEGAPYNIDAITSATLTIEGPAVKGYRAISLRQIEEATQGQTKGIYNEKISNKVVQNSYEGISVQYLIDNFVEVKPNAGNVVFKDKSRKPILTCSLNDIGKYTVAYGINEVPLVFLDTDVGYKDKKYNDNGCFKLITDQSKALAKEFSNIAYIYIEEKDAKNIYEHSYAPYNDAKYRDYELIIHGDGIGKEVRYKVSDIEAMKNIQVQKEYSLSNSEYFWYYNTYKGVPLWDLLIKSGMNSQIEENTKVQIIAADNYNFPPMTIKEIKDSSLYGYYEKSTLDKGDGTFDGKSVKPLYTGMEVLLAYGFNGYPYVTRPTDQGFNAGLGNDGGPIRIIFGKTDYQHTNGSQQVQFAKEIIIGEGTALNTAGNAAGTGADGEKIQTKVDENSSWKHEEGTYATYKDMPVLRVTGSQVKEPVTFTLGQIELLTEYAVRDVYTGDGIHEFEGIVLWDIISKAVELKDWVDVPSIRIFSGANYNQILKSNDQVINGVKNSKGEVKDIILAYAIDGYPLVANQGDVGYDNNNAFGPLRLIIEENKSMWVKWVDCIVVGTGDYEAPDIKDVKDIKKADSKTWVTYRNDTDEGLPEASVRTMEYDHQGNLWIGTNNGGLSMKDPKGMWTQYKKIDTVNNGSVNIDIVYAILQRENGELWITVGGPETAKGILVKTGDTWRLINAQNSKLPSNFVQELELDGNKGLWIGTGKGLAHIDEKDNWKIYDKKTGLALDSIDAIKPDEKGGVWIGYFVEAKGEGKDMVCKGAYQYIDENGKITTYTDFDNKTYGGNWVRSISIDTKGGVWITRSGNYTGQGHGEVDYITNGVKTVYKADQLYPDIEATDDIRFVHASKDGKMYIATKSSGILVCDEVGKISHKLNSDTVYPNKKWNDVYYIDEDGENIFVGTNGGVGVLTTPKISLDSAVDKIVLSFGENANDTVSLRFRIKNDNINNSAKVQYTEKSEYKKDTPFDNTKQAVISLKEAKEEGYTSFEVTIDKLKAGTEYIYQVGNDKNMSEPSTFTTAEDTNEYSFIYMGDSQKNPDECNTYEAWGKLLNKAYKDESNPKFVMIGGDLINEGDKIDEWNDFLSHSEDVFNKIALMPSVGNHDNTKLYKGIFILPQNGPEGKKETFYSFDYGDTHFTVLDSNTMGAANKDDIKWLTNDLKSSDKEHKIIMFHHPVYTVGNTPKDEQRAETFKKNWVPIFEKYGVDLVLNGHQHAYMRTYPIKNGSISKDNSKNSDEIVYLMGVSGGKKYPALEHQYIAKSQSDTSVYTIITVKDDELVFVTKDENGNIIDSYTIKD